MSHASRNIPSLIASRLVAMDLLRDLRFAKISEKDAAVNRRLTGVYGFDSTVRTPDLQRNLRELDLRTQDCSRDRCKPLILFQKEMSMRSPQDFFRLSVLVFSVLLIAVTALADSDELGGQGNVMDAVTRESAADQGVDLSWVAGNPLLASVLAAKLSPLQSNKPNCPGGLLELFQGKELNIITKKDKGAYYGNSVGFKLSSLDEGDPERFTKKEGTEIVHCKSYPSRDVSHTDSRIDITIKKRDVCDGWQKTTSRSLIIDKTSAGLSRIRIKVGSMNCAYLENQASRTEAPPAGHVAPLPLSDNLRLQIFNATGELF